MDELNEKITPAAPEEEKGSEPASEFIPEESKAAESDNAPSDESTEAPAENLPEPETDNTPAEDVDVKEAEVIDEIPTEQPKTVWSFAEQAKKDREDARKTGQKGAFIYAIVMTGLFAICFVVLAVLLITGFGSNSNQTVVVGPDASIADLVDSVKDSVVTVEVTTQKGSGFGSGFVYTDDGYIITNYHVIDGAETIYVVCADGRELPAELIDGDELSDVAVIKVNNLGLSKLAVGNSDDLRVGEYVVAIGTPVDIEYAGSVTLGIISGLKRTVRVYESSGLLEKSMEMIQTDTSLNPGNSGGPLFNMAGEVIGINTMKHVGSSTGDINYESLGFAIQINDAVEIADDIIEYGKYSGNKGSATQGVQLGITCGTVAKGVEIEVAPGVKITPETDGVVVTGINEGYPCYGKLELYDVIFSFDGVKTPTIEKMRAELFKHKVGDTVIIEVWRNGELVKVEVTL